VTRGALVLAIGLLAAACASAPPPASPPGRPPPAERGFRAATPQGVDLVYDARRRTYAVSGQPDVYWLDGRFFRRTNGSWEASPRLEGPWQPCPVGELPEGLRSAP
jgi:hypothetical protein